MKKLYPDIYLKKVEDITIETLIITYIILHSQKVHTIKSYQY